MGKWLNPYSMYFGMINMIILKEDNHYLWI